MKIATQHEIVSTVNDQVKQTVEFFVSEGWVPEDWIPSVRIDFLLYRNRSRGGGGGRYDRTFVSLETSRFLDVKHDWFKEYTRFEKDPEIGSIFGDRILSIRCMVVHEVCHALQYSEHAFKVGKMIGVTAFKHYKGHKLFWQTIYRLTRRALINPKDTLQIDPKASKAKVEKPYTSPLPPLKRKAAYMEIGRQACRGLNRQEIIDHLVGQHGMNKSTAAVYVSQAGAGRGTRPRKAKVEA